MRFDAQCGQPLNTHVIWEHDSQQVSLQGMQVDRLTKSIEQDYRTNDIDISRAQTNNKDVSQIMPIKVCAAAMFPCTE